MDYQAQKVFAWQITSFENGQNTWLYLLLLEVCPKWDVIDDV